MTAARRLRVEGRRVDCKSIFRRALDILDLRWQTAWPPRVLDFGHLRYYDKREWGDWIAGQTPANFSKRLLIVNPVLPLLDVIHNVQPRELSMWCQAAVQALQKLDDPTATLEMLFGVGLTARADSKFLLARGEQGRRY